MNTFSDNILREIQDWQKQVMGVISLPVVSSQQGEDMFMKGLQQIVKMDDRAIATLDSLPMEQLKEMSKLSDKAPEFAIYLAKQSLNVLDAAIEGKPNWYIQKHFSSEATAATGITSVMGNFGQLGTVDMAGLRAFRQVDATDSRAKFVKDFLIEAATYEIRKGEEPKATGLGDGWGELVDPRLYATLVRIDADDIKFLPGSANRIIAAMRYASLTMRSWAAYKALHMKGDESTYAFTADPKGPVGTANDGAFDAHWVSVNNARYNLNEGARLMIDHANGIAQGAKRQKNKTFSPLGITASEPIFVYYNHANQHFMNYVQSMDMGSGMSTINTPLGRNFVFISSTLSPVGGSWDLVTSEIYDDYGQLGSIKESNGGTKTGVRLVIPGRMNLALNFKSLTFAEETRPTINQKNYVGHEKHQFAVHPRQVSTVELTAG